MPVNWDEMQKEMYPIKDYDALRQRWQDAFSYSFVCETYNFTMPEIADYTQRLLGGDTRNRYDEYSQRLIKTFNQLHQARVHDIKGLVAQIDTCEQFEVFTEQVKVHEKAAIAVLKYLVYWVIPSKKYLSSLVMKGSPLIETIKALRNFGIRTNLDILQQGPTLAERKAIAEAGEFPEEEIHEIANRADFSRMPWASKATISNIIGAGYGSIEKLAKANPEQLQQDFHSYGASIGKNLKFGNEIESSYRIAKIIPLILEE